MSITTQPIPPSPLLKKTKQKQAIIPYKKHKKNPSHIFSKTKKTIKNKYLRHIIYYKCLQRSAAIVKTKKT